MLELAQPQAVSPEVGGDLTAKEFAYTPVGQQSLIDSLTGEEPGDDSREQEGDDGIENALDQPSDESQEIPESADELAATPEEQERYSQEMQQWQALPDEQKGQIADEYLTQVYDGAYSTITPQEAKEFTEAIGENWGVQDLSSKVDPIPFAVFSEAWSDHAQKTVALHPAGQDFLEAVADEQHPERALQLAASMCDPLMVQRFFSHFQNILGKENFAHRDPMQFAAECMVDLARLQGWGIPTQQEGERGLGSASPFETNQDIFNEETLGAFWGF